MEIFKRYRDYLQTLKDQEGLYEVNGEHRSLLSIEYTDGVRTAVKATDESSLYARAGKANLGSALSQCLTEPPEELLATAISMCTDSSVPMSVKYQSHQNGYEAVQHLGSAQELEEQLKMIDKELLFDGKTLNLQEVVETRWVCNQHGLARQFSRKRLELDVDFLGLHWNCSASAAALDLSNLKIDMEDQRRNQLPLGRCSSGVYPAVLSNFAFTKFWVIGWQLFSGLAQQNGASAFGGKLGKHIASTQLSLFDVAEDDDTGYAYPFDCEGSNGEAVPLIQHGVLTSALHNMSTGESTGNAGRTLSLVKGNAISVTPKNFLFDCGAFSTKELLAKLDDGLYIFDVFDEFHGINVASGQFSFPCKAVRIVNGEKTELLEGLTINGHISDLLQAVQAVGDHRCYMPLLMHQCWQVGAPAILVSKVQVTGNE